MPIRDATPGELRDLGLAPGEPALVATDDGKVVAGAVLDAAGSATEPGTPRLRLALVPGGDRGSLGELAHAMVKHAGASGLGRVTTGWDPMDHVGLKVLAGAGFEPTGLGPYVELGGGAVHHVTGYQDATGSVLDLAWSG